MTHTHAPDAAPSLLDALLPVGDADDNGAGVETRAEWTTKYINDLPDSAFAYVEPGGKKDDDGKTTPRSLRHFPLRDDDGDLDIAHVRNALSRLPTAKLPPAALAKIKRVVVAAAKKLGIDVSDDSTRAIDVAIILADGALRAAVVNALGDTPSDTPSDTLDDASTASPEAQTPTSSPQEAIVVTTHASTSHTPGAVVAADDTAPLAAPASAPASAPVPTDASVETPAVAPVAPVATRAASGAGYATNPNTVVDGHALAWAPITRVDAERREIEGVMTDEQVDTFGTIFDYDTMKQVVQEAWAGNIREQHDRNKAVGRKVDVAFDDAARRITLRARISAGAEDTWQKVLDGTLSGFSIGASDIRVKAHRMVGNRSIPVLAPAGLAEVSVVDAPSNPGAAESGLTIYRSAEGGVTAEGERVFDDFAPVEAAIAAIVAETDAARASVNKPTPAEAADVGVSSIAPATKALSGTATGDDIDDDDDHDKAGNDGGASYDNPEVGSTPIKATSQQPGVQDATAEGVTYRGADALKTLTPPTDGTPVGTPVASMTEAVAQAQAEARATAEAAQAASVEANEAAEAARAAKTGKSAAKGKKAAVKAQPKGDVNSDGEGGKDGGTGSDGADGEGGAETDGADGTRDDGEEAQEPDTKRANIGDGDVNATEHAGAAGVGQVDWEARDARIAAAEKAITKDSTHAHPAHDHEHASGYEVVHFHDHTHEHLDGTQHAHPHMHAHDHHDHYGDPTHTHPHTHTHDHSHEYRAWAPDQSRIKEPQPMKTTAVAAAVATGTPAPAAAPVMAEDGRVLVGVTTRADDVAAPVAAATPPAPHTHADGHTYTHADDTAPVAPVAAVTATTRAQEPEAARVGKRISASTEAKLHAAIVAALDACGCDLCLDAASLYGDDDDDGDADDSDDDDGAADVEGRVQTPSMTRRAVRHAAHMQRITLARATRAAAEAVVQAEVTRALAPIAAQMRGITARLAQITAPTGTPLTLELAETLAPATASDVNLPSLADDVAAMRSQMTQMSDLMALIAAQPQTGNAPVVQAGAEHRALLGDRRAVMDASVTRGAAGGNPNLAIAEALTTLRNAGVLPAANVPQETQIASAAALIQAGR